MTTDNIKNDDRHFYCPVADSNNNRRQTKADNLDRQRIYMPTLDKIVCLWYSVETNKKGEGYADKTENQQASIAS